MTYSGSLAQAGRGSILAIGDSPTTIGEVTNSPINRGEWDQEDVTNFESGSDSEVINTIRKTGTLDIELNRVSSDAGQVLVEDAYQSGAPTAFTLTLPKTAAQTDTGDVYTFNALVKGSSFTVDVTKAIKGKIALVVTGGMTLTVGS